MLQKEILKQFLMMKAGINNAYTVLFFDRYFTILYRYCNWASYSNAYRSLRICICTTPYIYVYFNDGMLSWLWRIIISIFLGVMTDVYFGSIYGVYLFGYILFLALIDRFLKFFTKIIRCYSLLY